MLANNIFNQAIARGIPSKSKILITWPIDPSNPIGASIDFQEIKSIIKTFKGDLTASNQLFPNQFKPQPIWENVEFHPESDDVTQRIVSLLKSKPAQTIYLTTSYLPQSISTELDGFCSILPYIPNRKPDNTFKILRSNDQDHSFEGIPTDLLRRVVHITKIQADNTEKFLTFLHILAQNVGRPLNLQSISKQVNLSRPHLKRWLNILIGYYVIFLVQPHQETDKDKHTISKMPKLFFTDPDFATYLIRTGPRENASSFETENKHCANCGKTIEGVKLGWYFCPICGTRFDKTSLNPTALNYKKRIFENLVACKIWKTAILSGRKDTLSYQMDYTGHEINLIRKSKDNLMELILTSDQGKISLPDQTRFENMCKNFPAETLRTIVYCGETKSADRGNIRLINFEDYPPKQ